MRFSLPEFVSDLSADVTTVSLDMPGGGYDRLHQYLEQRGSLPRTNRGRTALVALLLVASRLVKQQLGPMGPVTNFLNEIGEDAVREEAKRILEAAQHANAAAALDGSPRSGLNAVWEMDDAARTQLLDRYRHLDPEGQQQMRDQMLRSTTVELGILADMPRENLRTLLDILSPAQIRSAGILDSLATGLFPWLKTKENRRRPWRNSSVD